LKKSEWASFLVMTSIWGSSYLWIKLGLREVGPFALVGSRLLLGAIVLSVVVAARRPGFPRTAGGWLGLIFLGLVNNALPFILVSWSEQHVDSAIASVLISTVPLFTLVISAIFLRDERIALRRILGLVVGFAGIVVLMSRDVRGSIVPDNLGGYVALLAASLSYAVGGVYARRNLSGLDATVQAYVPIAAADLLAWGGVWATAEPLNLPAHPLTWLSILWLGIMGSGYVYVLYYRLLHSVGPVRLSTGAYLIALIGVVLGVLFLGERLDWRLAVGGGLVIVGVLIVNTRSGAERRFEPKESVARPDAV
jgi:drug/metabolite transporter (DMT)-like permease